MNTYPIVVSGTSVKFANGKLAPVLIIGSESPMFIAGPKPESINEGDLLSLNDDEAVVDQAPERQPHHHLATSGLPRLLILALDPQ